MTLFWNILKWNRGPIIWDGRSNFYQQVDLPLWFSTPLLLLEGLCCLFYIATSNISITEVWYNWAELEGAELDKVSWVGALGVELDWGWTCMLSIVKWLLSIKDRNSHFCNNEETYDITN